MIYYQKTDCNIVSQLTLNFVSNTKRYRFSYNIWMIEIPVLMRFIMNGIITHCFPFEFIIWVHKVTNWLPSYIRFPFKYVHWIKIKTAISKCILVTLRKELRHQHPSHYPYNATGSVKFSFANTSLPTTIFDARFEAFTVMRIQVTVFWVATPCSDVTDYLSGNWLKCNSKK
jgi:hypothetical protein